jgi:non-canonical purine NTP pyrophosphatase (RdgB/HAM1 family)
MKKLVFVTGNPKKAGYATELLGIDVECRKIDLPEIQSLDTKEIIEAKLRVAYEELKCPLIVEDVSLCFEAMGKLPGPFIKFFIAELGQEGLCRLLDGKSRKATATCTIGYTDGEREKYFVGTIRGTIAQSPQSGPEGFGSIGWSEIFIPDGYETAFSTLSHEVFTKHFLMLRRYDLLKEMLNQ